MVWNFTEYRQLVINRYGQLCMDDLEKHSNTLKWNQQKILLHKEAIEQCWNNIFQPSIVSFGDKKFKNGYFFSMAEGEAIIHSLHSNADILAHLINVILDSSKLLINEVYFGTVLGELKKHNIAPNVAKTMQELLDTPEFKYVKAFCNTIKHYCLINASWSPGNVLNPGGYEKIKSSMKFNPFIYKNNDYSEVHLHNIYESYTVTISDKICAIGNNLNNFLSRV